MSDLVAKWAAARDVIHHGLSRRGVATGLSLSSGRQWIATGGLHLLCRGTEYDDIDTDQPVGAAPAGEASVQQFTWIKQEANTLYYFTVMPVGAGGVEAVSNDARPQIVSVLTDDDGDAGEPVPAAPHNLRAVAIAGGAFKLAWSYMPAEAGPRVDKFNIYSNDGSGEIDYDTPVDTVDARVSRKGAGEYVFESDPFSHALYVKWGVRAADASDNEEANELTAVAQADAVGPTAHEIARAVCGDDE